MSLNDELKEAIEKADLNFIATKTPVVYYDNLGERHRFHNRYVTIREDNAIPFEVVSSTYKIRQHAESFNFLQDLGVTNIVKVESENRGARMVIQAELPNDLLLSNGDNIKRYITCLNSHDRSSSSVICITPTRFRCMNQFNMFSSKANKSGYISIRHNDKSDVKFSDIKKILGLMDNSFELIVEQQNQLLNIPIEKRNVSGYIRTLFGTKEELIAYEQKGNSAFTPIRIGKLKEIISCYNTGIGQKELDDTAYRLFNGVTYYLNHETDNKPTSLIEGKKAEIINNTYKLFI